jgi:hypothetical protein
MSSDESDQYYQIFNQEYLHARNTNFHNCNRICILLLLIFVLLFLILVLLIIFFAVVIYREGFVHIANNTLTESRGINTTF